MRRKVWTFLPDGEVLYRTYFEMGRARSYGKLARKLGREGHINKRSGKPPTHMAIWFRMWRWALKRENQQTAYYIFNGCMKDEGEYYSFQKFKEYLDDKALTCFNYDPKSLEQYRAGTY